MFDIGHQSVGFEDIPVSLQKLVDAGVPIFKLQEVAAMRIPEVTDEAVEALGRFAKSIYLTQTVEKKNGRLTRFLNLEDAFRAWKSEPGPTRMAHSFSRAGLFRRSRPIRYHAFCARGSIEISQGDSVVAPA